MRILQVDDNSGDLLVTRLAGEACGDIFVHSVERPERLTAEATDFGPDLVLMDWALNGVSGLELLRRLKADDELRDLPVVILAGGLDEGTLLKAYQAGAAGCFIKPFDFEATCELMRTLYRYWSLAVLPTRARKGSQRAQSQATTGAA